MTTTDEKAPAPAAVPMPEAVERAMVKVIDTSADVVCASDEWNKENDANFKRLLKRSKDAQAELRATVQQYGDAREAAGYARGLRDAVRDADIEALRLYVRALCKAVDAATDFIGTVAGGASWWDDVWAAHAAALDRARERISQAALRGEVK